MFSVTVMLHLNTGSHDLVWLEKGHTKCTFKSIIAAKRAATIERHKNPERIHAMYVIDCNDQVVSTWHKFFKKWES